MLLTSVISLRDGDVGSVGDGAAGAENSLDAEVALSWTDGDLCLGLSTVLALRPVLTVLRPLNQITLDVRSGSWARDMLRTMEWGYLFL